MSPRKKFIEKFSNEFVDKRFVGYVFDAMQLASTHDPDHAQEIRRHDRWINRLFARTAKSKRIVK
jgi:hypothetical protein